MTNDGSLLPLAPGSRSALLIVDMQAYFFRLAGRRHGLEHVINNINRLIHYFDARKLPIFHILSVYQADGSDWDLKMRKSNHPELIRGDPETSILPEIQVLPSHSQVVKTRYSAFFKTNLAERLNALDVRRVVVVGAYTHYCVNATIFDAYAHDFVPCLVTDAVLSHLPEETDLLVRRMRRNGYHILATGEVLDGR